MRRTDMISVDEALRILNANMPEPRLAYASLENAFSCYLAEDIYAPEASPRYRSSAMDGFAVRWADLAGVGADNPARLKIIGESQAGIPFPSIVSAGAAVRISTGAVVPEGADAVVRVEDTRESSTSIEILAAGRLGQDIRQEGEEFAAGALLFARGSLLKSRELALLAAVGIVKVPVYAQPRVALLITGTELAQHDDPAIQPHQIRDSNSIMLSSAIKESGATLVRYLHVEDSLEKTIAAVQQSFEAGVDIVLCSGGVSVGRHDHVKDASVAAGFQELFWRISQKPGKPLFVCRKGATLLFGLPGNPVSAFMCFSNYVRPVLARLLGTSIHQRSLVAVAKEKVANPGKRTNFVRVAVQEKPNELPVLTEVVQQGSHMLSSIVNADGYIILQPGEVLEAGKFIDVVLF
jgi:molybdopterin molybdotransferase